MVSAPERNCKGKDRKVAMELKEIRSVAVADEEIAIRTAEMESIKADVEKRKAEFESADVETQEKIADEMESANKRFSELKEEIAQIKELRDRLEKAESRFSLSAQLSEGNVEERKAKMDTKLNYRESEEYVKAYRDDIIAGDSNFKRSRAVMERAGVTTGTDNVPVPTIMQGYVETAWAKYGKFSRLVRSISVRGMMKVPFEKSATAAVFHTEGSTAPTEETITLGSVLLDPVMIKKWVSMTHELIALAPEEFLKYISDEVVYQVVKLLDDSIISGAGTSGAGVVGVVNDANGLITKENVALTFNTHNILASDLIASGNLTVAMNPKTFYGNIMGMTDETGRPIYNILSDNDGRARLFLGGMPVELTDALKSYDSASANDPYMVVGDFSGYTLNRPEGDNVILLRDPYTLATEDKVRLIGRLLAAGAVTKPKYFAVATKVSG